MRRKLRAATVLTPAESVAVAARAAAAGTSAAELLRSLMLSGAVPRSKSAPNLGRRAAVRIWCSDAEYRAITRHAIAMRYPSLAGAMRDVLLFGEVP